MKKYTIKYFIRKFSRIPRSKWTCGALNDNRGKSCALGFCGVTDKKGNYRMTLEAKQLAKILSDGSCTAAHNVHTVNDAAYHNTRMLGKHPRTRILRALKARLVK